MTAATRIPYSPTAFSLSHGKKRPRDKSATHLDYLRTLPCIVTGQEAEAAHIRYGSLEQGKRETGKSEKPDDKWAVPLSPDEHRLGNHSQHTMNEREYWARVGIDPVVVAALLWAASGDYEAGLLICQATRAQSLSYHQSSGEDGIAQRKIERGEKI